MLTPKIKIDISLCSEETQGVVGARCECVSRQGDSIWATVYRFDDKNKSPNAHGLREWGVGWAKCPTSDTLHQLQKALK